jgi:AraC-like DNA-binding protein
MSLPDLIDASSRLGGLPGLRSHHVGEAVAAMSSRYRSHSLTPAGMGAELDFRHHAVDLGRASLNLLRYGPEVAIDAGSFDTFYMIEIPLSGGVDLDYGGQHVSSDTDHGLVLSPGRHVRSLWRADTTQLMLRLERSLVEQIAAARTGSFAHPTPAFAPRMELAGAAGRRIVRLMQMLALEQIEASREGTKPPSAEPLLGAIVDTLFEHQPGRSLPDRQGPLPWYLNRLRAMLDDPAALTLSVAELAAAIGITPRGLAAGMRRFSGITPHDYLTRRRMEHARRLIEDGAGVAEAAARVGYANAGRFASTFRGHFGANPSNHRKPAH